MRRRLLAVAGSVIVAALVMSPLGSPAGLAAEPGSGTLVEGGDPVTWTGGPFPTAFNVTGCVIGFATGDNFNLEVQAHHGEIVEVSVETGDELARIDLTVVDQLGQQLSYTPGTGQTATTYFAHNADHGTYQVRVGGRNATENTTFTGTARFGGNAIDLPPPDCLQATPSHIDPTIWVEGGDNITLGMYVLVDPKKTFLNFPVADWTARAVEQAKTSYEPLGIDLVVTGVDIVEFDTVVSTELIQAGKDYFGGQPPAGSDVVFVATNKNITGSDGSASVAGQADCIGGIAHPANSFFVGEITNTSDSLLNDSFDAIVVAHELGHILGAHHHLGNCLQGNVDADSATPCTVMLTGGVGMSLNFGVTNGSIVRAHTDTHARP